jgi:hypothetical protein
MLGPRHFEILDKLSEVGGFTTRRVAQLAWESCDRKGSAQCRQVLLWLQKEGYIGTLDDQLPVCWVRTTKGTTALHAAIEAMDFIPWRG